MDGHDESEEERKEERTEHERKVSPTSSSESSREAERQAKRTPESFGMPLEPPWTTARSVTKASDISKGELGGGVFLMVQTDLNVAHRRVDHDLAVRRRLINVLQQHQIEASQSRRESAREDKGRQVRLTRLDMLARDLGSMSGSDSSARSNGHHVQPSYGPIKLLLGPKSTHPAVSSSPGTLVRPLFHAQLAETALELTPPRVLDGLACWSRTGGMTSKTC